MHAIIDHHLSYKQEADVPTELRRKLNALSGLFSTADDQFDAIRHERAAYVTELRKLTRAQFLAQELNLDTLKEYLRWKFPRLRADADEALLRRVLRGAQGQNIVTLSQLNSLVEKTKRARAAIAKESRPIFGATHVNRALALMFPAYFQKAMFSPEARTRIMKYRSLVK